MIFIYLLIICLFIIFIINLVFNFVIIKRNYKITTKKIENNIKVMHLSDIHGIKTAYKANKILKVAQKEKPDIILLTGDLIDKTDYKNGKCPFEATIDFMKNLLKYAPVYYVFGNHEKILLEDKTDKGFKFVKALEESGIKIMNNESDKLLVNGNNITILGIQEPQIVSDYDPFEKTIEEELRFVFQEIKGESLKILLVHRPEYFEIYSEYDIDICLAGHAHGGQVRLPFIKGLFAPNQGWFPKYTKGKYELKNSQMIVSPGLGNSIIKLRVFDPLEINIISIEK